MRLLVDTASRGMLAMALAWPLFFAGCDASKAELEATKTKLTAITAERDGLKTQLATALASVEGAKKEREGVAAKLATCEADAAAKAVPPEAPPPPVAPVAPVKPAAPSGPVKKVTAKNSALSNALLEKGPAVNQCAVEHGMDKGAKRVTVSVRVTINNTGHVMDSQITANVVDGDSSKVKSCVEAVVRTAKFPSIPTPMATEERSWTVAAE